MAIVVDAARTSSTPLTAMNAFTQPTPRTMQRGYAFAVSGSVETHVPGSDGAATDNTADAWVPHVDATTFWLPSVSKTVRPS